MSLPNRQKRGESTRADIVQVAKRLFSERGYHSTGLSDIQAATGMTKGAFYHHFRSKEDLALAVLEQATCDYAELLIKPALSESSPGRQLGALLDGVMQLNSQPEWANCQMVATLCAELTSVDGSLHEAVQKMISRRLDMLAELIRKGQASGEIDPAADPVLWAQWINCTFLGLIVSRKLGAVRSDPRHLMQQIKNSLFIQRPAAAHAGHRADGRHPS